MKINMKTRKPKNFNNFFVVCNRPKCVLVEGCKKITFSVSILYNYLFCAYTKGVFFTDFVHLFLSLEVHVLSCKAS